MVEPNFTPQLTRLERQLSVTLGLASLSTETKGVAHFVARCLELLARSYGFVIAQYWTVDASQETVQCSDVWFSLAAMPDFRRASKERRMSKGVGLPGRAWGIGAPIYVPHRESEMGTRFPRKEIALRVGLTSGFAFPVKNGPRVRSVFEFYSFETIEENAEDLRFFEKLGCVIGGLIEEKQEQENTNYQERFYDAIIRNCPQAIIAIDAHGLVTHWNRQAEHFFAWSLDEAVGRQLGDLIIPERYRAMHNQGVLRYLRTRSAVVINKMLRVPAINRHGEEFTIDMRIQEFDTPGMANEFGFVAFVTKSHTELHPEITLT